MLRMQFFSFSRLFSEFWLFQNISGRKCRPVYKICALHVRCDFCLVLVKYFLLLLFLVLVLPWPILIKAPFSAFSYIGVSVFARKMGEFPKNERRLYNSIGRHHISFLFLTCRIFNPRRLRSVFVWLYSHYWIWCNAIWFSRVPSFYCAYSGLLLIFLFFHCLLRLFSPLLLPLPIHMPSRLTLCCNNEQPSGLR